MQALVQLASILHPTLIRQVARDLIPLVDAFAQVSLKCSEGLARFGGIAALKLQLGDALVLNVDPAAKLVDAIIEL